jgi:D-3-phosphoglycerate dehydrogenase
VLAENRINVLDMVNKSRGDLGINIIDAESSITDEAVEAIKAVQHVIRVRVLPPAAAG